jgi:non-heme chloroperoxidase
MRPVSYPLATVFGWKCWTGAVQGEQWCCWRKAETLRMSLMTFAPKLTTHNHVYGITHSIAGAELSWIANRYPHRVAGVVYLEAGYSYAFDDGKGASALDMMKLQAPQSPPPGAADLVSFKALQRYEDRMDGFEFPEGEIREERQTNPDGTVGDFRDPPGGGMLMKLISGGQKYTRIPVPSLFIFANPHSLGA